MNSRTHDRSADPGDDGPRVIALPALRLGLLSDTHGDVTRAAVAVRRLEAAGAELLLHLGDIDSEAVLEELAGHRARVVFGNCDDESALARHAARLGIPVDHPLGILDVGGARLAYTHGHLPRAVEAARGAGARWLFHGHTHELRDERVDGLRIVNPGALSRARRYTVAIVDPGADDVTVLELEHAGSARRH